MNESRGSSLSARLAMTAGVLLGLTACAAGDTTSPTDTPSPVATTVTLSATTVVFASLAATEQLTATVRDQNGATMAGAPLSWASSDMGVATVSSSGLVTSVGDGSATLTASSGSVSASASVAVEQVVASVTLSPDSLTLTHLGDTASVVATASDAGGSQVVAAVFAWGSSDESVVTVSAAGLVTAVAKGRAVISATSAGRTGAMSLDVIPAPIDLAELYYVALGGVPRYRLSLNQTGSSLTFSLDGEGSSYTGAGTIDGTSVSLTATGMEHESGVTLTFSLELSADATSFTGTAEYSAEESSTGTVTGSTSPWPTHDVAAEGLPLLVEANYIELEPIDWVSLFRSSQGHDSTDDFEVCRNMKHHFQPASTVDWSEIRIYSPIEGTIVGWTEEADRGAEITIGSGAFPGIAVTLFHVLLPSPPSIGQAVSAGEPLGTHIGNQDNSDVAVGIVTPDGYRLVSYFDLMTDELFEEYIALGASSRSDFIITAAERDADPLTCDGEDFVTLGALPRQFELGAALTLITPFVLEAEMGPIHEAFSTDDSAPWGFPHDGIDFFPLADGGAFQAGAAGTVEAIELSQNGQNWQVNVRIRHTVRYLTEYGFEPFSSDPAVGEAQLARISVTVGQQVASGDVLGLLTFAEEGAHVHFGVHDRFEAVCPGDFFTEEARASVLRLLWAAWPEARICH